MKVRLPKPSQPDVKFIRKSIEEELVRARQEERETTVRRMIKLMSYVLHVNEGFGKTRVSRTAMGISDLINQGLDYWEGNVGDFWYKIDSDLEECGMNFYPSEDEINKEQISKL